jgi:hypothetical protein
MIAPVIRVLPVILIVIFSAPAWLSWPFLTDDRRQTVLQMVDALARWTRGEHEVDASGTHASKTAP